MRNQINDALFKAEVPDPSMVRAADQLEAALDNVPGFREANRAYREMSERRAAYVLGGTGRHSAGRLSLPDESIPGTASGIEQALERLPRHTHDAYRAGLRSRIQQDLELNRPSQILTDALSMNPEQVDNSSLRMLFPPTQVGGGEFNDFLRLLRREQRTGNLSDIVVNQAQRTTAQSIVNPFFGR